MAVPNNVGEYAPDGSIKTEASVCAFSGRPYEPGDVTVNIAGTSFFYRVKASAWRGISADQRTEFESTVRGKSRPQREEKA